MDLFDKERHKYTAEHVRKSILHPLMSRLIRYRFIKELPRPQGLEVSWDQYIYEALPALYHYNSGMLGNAIGKGSFETAPDGGFAEPEEEDEDEQA
jgi:hypothetical protein